MRRIAPSYYKSVFLLLLIPAVSAPLEAESWEREAFFGLNLARGNSDALAGNLKVDARRGDVLNLVFSSSYGKSGGEKNLDRSSARARWRKNFESGFYAGAGLKAERDAMSGLDYRYTLSPAAGQRFIRTETDSLSLEAGPAYFRERSGGKRDSGPAARFFEGYERRLTETSRLSQSLEYTLSGGGDYLAGFGLGVVSALTPGVNLRADFELGYDNSPPGGGKRYDLAFIMSLGFGF